MVRKGSGGSSLNRTSCLTKELYNWGDNSYNDCKNNDWLYNSRVQWTITLDLALSCRIFTVYGSGTVNFSDAYDDAPVLPSVYLKSSVAIVNGNGSKESPYELLGD